MPILLPILAFIALLAFAPEAAMKLGAWFAVTTVTVRVSADKLVGCAVSYGEAAWAVIYAAIAPVLVIFGLLSFGASTGITQFQGAGTIVILAILLGSFIAAFMLALHTSFKDSAIIAAVTTATSVALALLIRGLT
ncbi:hypothetical protein [Lysobacter capsici]|uniref:hypothetical protein n=1 Tax=Lysobacter capsici TaxID=435897 RepID=UPI000627C56C|nr:hypothetical protein [Lysobacter capsici]